VVCIDKDAAKIDSLKAGRMPIYEPGLAEVVADNVKAGRLFFTTEIADNVRDADAVFIAVGTLSRRGDGHADLSCVFAAAEEIAASLNGYTVVITKSTVPVGTGLRIEDTNRRIRPDADFVPRHFGLGQTIDIEASRIPDRGPLNPAPLYGP